MPKLGNNLDFNKNEAQNIILHKLAAAPANPTNGQMYYNTADKKAYIYEGSKWVDMTSQGKIYNGVAPIVVDNDNNTVSINLATKSSSGAMSSTDKTNLDGLIDGSIKAKKAENADSADKVKNALTIKGKSLGVENSIDFNGSEAKAVEFDDTPFTCDIQSDGTLRVSMPWLHSNIQPQIYWHKIKFDNYGRVTDYSNKVDIATTEALGSVKIGERLSITEDGTLSADKQTDNNYTTAEKNKLAGIAEGANKYELPVADKTTLGGIKVGDRLSITADGILSANKQTDNNYTTEEKTKLAGIESGANKYELPKATTSILGGVTIGDRITVADGKISADKQTDNNYTDGEKDKLLKIQYGAQKNVQSNWTETDEKSDAYIQNKPVIDNFITSDNIIAGEGIVIEKTEKNNTISTKTLQHIYLTYSEEESSGTDNYVVFESNSEVDFVFTQNRPAIYWLDKGSRYSGSFGDNVLVYLKINNQIYKIETINTTGATATIKELRTCEKTDDFSSKWEFIGYGGTYNSPKTEAVGSVVGGVEIYPTAINLADIETKGYYYYDIYGSYSANNKLDLNTLTNVGYYVLRGWDNDKVANYPADMATQSGMTGNAWTVCLLEVTSSGSQKLSYRKYNNTISGNSIVLKTITEYAWYRSCIEGTFLNWIYNKEEIEPYSDDVERTKAYHYVNLQTEGYSETNKFDFHSYFSALLETIQNYEELFGNYVLYNVYPDSVNNAPPATIYASQTLYATWSINDMQTTDDNGNYINGVYVLKVKIDNDWYSCGIINQSEDAGWVWSNWVKVLPTKADIGLGNVTNDAQVKRSEMGVANGVATLDENAKIKTAQLPDYLLGQLLYGGTVTTGAVATLTDNAKKRLGTTNTTITLTNDTSAITGYKANEGIFYIAQANFSFAGISYLVGDWVISNGAGWTKVDNTDSVTSVNGKIGTVVLTASDVGALPDNTTYVSSVAQGTENGTIAVSVKGGAATNVAVKGLGTAAYKTTGRDTGNVPVIGGNLGQTANVPIVTNTSGELVAHPSGALGTAAFKGVDTTPTANSNNLITSGGVKSAIDAIPKGSVTSVALTMPTGFSVTGSPITTAGTLAVALADGYSLMRKKVFDITTSTAVDTGTTATYTLTHNLGTKDISVTVRETTSGEIVLTDMVASTDNAVKIIFSAKPTINYRVVII